MSCIKLFDCSPADTSMLHFIAVFALSQPSITTEDGSIKLAVGHGDTVTAKSGDAVVDLLDTLTKYGCPTSVSPISHRYAALTFTRFYLILAPFLLVLLAADLRQRLYWKVSSAVPKGVRLTLSSLLLPRLKKLLRYRQLNSIRNLTP